MKNNLRFRFAASVLAACAISVLAASRAGAQVFQTNWLPNEYRLYCEPDTGVKGQDGTVPRGASRTAPCKSPSAANKIVKNIKEAMFSLKAIGFKPPIRFGERIGAGKRAPADYIRLYDIDTGGIANTTAPCPNTTISIGEGIKNWWRDYLVFLFLSHESFHAVSHAYPTTSKNCEIPPGWIFEGTADAVALDLTRKKFGDSIPLENEVDKVHAKFAGLRRFDVPLNFDLRNERGEAIQTGLTIHYNTSSLFRFIADAFHGGDYKYIHDYLSYARRDRNWMAWLNDNVEKRDGEIKQNLGLVHSAFVSSFAGWGDPGLPGNKHYGRKRWLDRAFGGCERVRLSRTETAGSVEMTLRPSSAKCVEVIVGDVGPEDRLTIQVGALDPTNAAGADFGLADQLYLGLAESTDTKQFHCARWIKKMGKKAVGHCIFIGDTGTLEIDGEKHKARVWNVIAQSADAAPGPDPRSQVPGRRGKMSNLYMISRMDPQPSDKTTTSDGGKEEPFTLWFSLDVSDLEVSPAVAAQKPAGSVTKRIVGQINGEPVTNSQETVPMQNAKGNRTVTYTNPAVVRPGLFDSLPSMPVSGLSVLKDLQTLQVSAVWSKEISTYEDTIDDFETYVAQPLQKQGNGWVPRSIRIGETGTFPASVNGGPTDGSAAFATREPGRIVIHEFTYFTLRATITATLCNVLKMRKSDPCPERRTIKGEIIKGFPGARLPGKAFTIYDTPGTAIYRRAKQVFLSGGSAGTGAGGNGSGGAGSGTGPAGGGAATGKTGCDCSCKAYSDMKKLGDSMKGKRPTPAQIARLMNLAKCGQQCSVKWKTCKKKP